MSSVGFTFGDIGSVPSGRLVNGLLGDETALQLSRQGVGGVLFDGKGRAPMIPWEQIRRIEVLDDRAEFHLYSGLVGYVPHDPADKEAKDWYIKLEGILITWALQSGEKCSMPDGRVVYNQGVPKIVYRTITEKSKVRPHTSSNQVVDGGKSIVSEVSPIMMFHEDFWEYVRKHKEQRS